jgi:hypothetical protein
MKLGTNAPTHPSFEGQLVVFPSPHAADVLLVDRAVKNTYGHLTWVALLPDDPVALKAIADHQAMQVTDKLKRALSKPSEIFRSFCSASLVAGVAGAGSTITIPSAPAGGRDTGWWSNGVFLMFKKTAVLQRCSVEAKLLVNKHHFDLISASKLVTGLCVEVTDHFA